MLVKCEESPYTTCQQKAQIDHAIRYLDAHLYDKDLKISALSEICGLSAPSFRRIFRSRFGTTPKKYLTEQRMLGAKLILESGEYESIAQIADLLGYEDPLYFSKCFKDFYGIAPSRFDQ